MDEHEILEELLILMEAEVMAGVKAHKLHHQQQQQQQQQLSKHLRKYPLDGMVGLRLLLICSTSCKYHHATLVRLDIRHNQFQVLILLDNLESEEDTTKTDESKEETEDMKIEMDHKENNHTDIPNEEVANELKIEQTKDQIKKKEKMKGTK